MSLGELSAPIRAYVDLPGTWTDPAEPGKLAGGLVKAGILAVALRETTGAPAPETMAIVTALVDAACFVSLTLPASQLDPGPGIAHHDHPGLRELLFHADSAKDALRLLRDSRFPGSRAQPPGLSMTTTRDNLSELPAILALCSERGIRRLVLPITRAACADTACSLADTFLTTAELEDLAERLVGVDYDAVDVTVHDPFLWQAIHPKGSYHEEGCQAGNTFIYVSPTMDVLSCPLLPVPLGNLGEMPLCEILQAPSTKAARASLKGTASACDSCEDLERCRGGCRGRAYVCEGSLEARDPACLRVLT